MGFNSSSIITTIAARPGSMTRCPRCARIYQRQEAYSSICRARLTRNDATRVARDIRSMPSIASFSTSTKMRASSIMQPSLWSSMIPKPFRSSGSSLSSNSKNSRPERGTDHTHSKSRFGGIIRFWKNPATPFMLLGLLLGSQSVRMIVLRMEREKMRERTEARLRTLREVLEAVKAGEDVDVRARLGTGKEKDEKEWEAVIHNLATDEIILKSRRAAWRERKEAQNRDTQKGAVETDEAGKAETTEDELTKARKDNKSAMISDKINENDRKKIRAEFY